jgi:murein DD-endopeptidase MepM/ murein hydrolase activator NlpD
VITITAVLLFMATQLSAASFSVYELSGRVGVSDASGERVAPGLQDLIQSGTTVRTSRDSLVSFSGNGYYYRVYAYSLVRIQDEPVLVYGKLSKSKSGEFVGLHFYYLPTPAQGRTMKVVASSTENDINVESSLLWEDNRNRPLTMYRVGEGRYRALTGFDCEAPAVRYKLSIRATKDGVGYTQVIYPFYLRVTSFSTGRVRLSPEKETLFQPSERKRREIDRLKEVLSTSTEQKLWENTFNHPLDNPEIISAFGKRRSYYLGGKIIRVQHHRGIDYRALQGTPVYAPNHGLVVLAAERVTTGNTVVIDHGHGVFSLFFHLDSIFVEEGSRMRRGDKIAEAGSTGITAGPHLHWGLLVDGIYVNPQDWIKRSF